MKTNIIASNFREFIVKTLADFVRLGHWISFTIICTYWECPTRALKSSVIVGLVDTPGLAPLLFRIQKAGFPPCNGHLPQKI